MRILFIAEIIYYKVNFQTRFVPLNNWFEKIVTNMNPEFIKHHFSLVYIFENFILDP